MGRFEGKIAIVTGGTAGIGRAVAARLVGEGARVIVVARSKDRGEAAIAQLGDAAQLVVGTVDHRETADQAVAAAVAAGGPDVLINNAGIDHTNDLLETPEDEARQVFDTNFFGALWMLQRCGATMKRAEGGAIVNVTSRLASIGIPTMGVYAASKGALLALTRNAAVELAPHRIRVNAVAPGPTETPLIRAWIDQQPDPAAFRRKTADTVPQGTFGTPEDVAAAIAFMASDEAAHITGASLAIDGGYTAS